MSSVKNKIRAGTIFLFVLVVISGAFSIYFLFKLKSDSENIIRANYESLEFVSRMQMATDSILVERSAWIDTFSVHLIQQQNNITEPGELELTQNLQIKFNNLKAGDTSSVNFIKKYLQEIFDLNMAAIKAKSFNSEKSTKDALTYLIAIVSIIILVGLTFVYNFPSIITNPVNRLTDAIAEISNKNYKHRIHINSNDEFGKMASAFNEMAERLEYFESSNLARLIFEKTRAEAVINSLKDASIGIDKHDKVLFANNQALQLLGLAAKDIVGVSVAEVSSKNDLFKFLLEEKSTTPFKVVVENRENYFTKETIDIAQDGSSSKVIVLKNITSFKELDVAKTNFIATVSHELKTPLASSDFSLKLLGDARVGMLSTEQKELIQSLKNDNQRMLRILSELLNMSQVEAGKINLDIQPVSPYNIVEISLNAVASALKEKDLKIEKILQPNLPVLNGDRDKITWVLNNFLTNAIQYSPVKSIVIIDVRQENDSIVFSVADKGQGIDDMYLSRIFERYFQVPGRSDKKGSGIGLAICKEFVESMSGKIWVKSTPGAGSIFGFSLPVDNS